MFEIRKATINDCAAIQEVAEVVFPITYREILTPEQLDYMMDWMYSTELQTCWICIYTATR